MKKVFAVTSFFTCLLACSCNTKSNMKGIIDCSSISISSSNTTFRHSVSYSMVYEYENSSTDSRIYTSTYPTTISSSLTSTPATIRVYTDKYDLGKYSEYSYSGFIGYITVETNYYLNLDSKIIDCETKYTEYTSSYNPLSDQGEEYATPNNQFAYEKAKAGYYTSYSRSSDYYYVNAQTDETGLERHSYISYGDYLITYAPKK